MEREYCYYCMSRADTDGVCAVCGHRNDEYEMSTHHIKPGTMLSGRYVVGRVLGEGGFGITYLGFDERLETKVAIKEYFPKDSAARVTETAKVTGYTTGSRAAGFERGKQKFLREARTMAKMNKQQSIVSVQDYFEENDTAYIVMEFIEGITLTERVQSEGTYTPDELFPLIRPIFGALSELHKSELIHRDISPDNIMIDNGSIKLIDLGVAHSMQNSETMTITLKQDYAPIEQYQSGGQGPWTDIYALGATIFFCLTGSAPQRAFDRLTGDTLEMPGVLSENQSSALKKALDIYPKDRWQTVDEMCDALYASDVSQPGQAAQEEQTAPAESVRPKPEKQEKQPKKDRREKKPATEAQPETAPMTEELHTSDIPTTDSIPAETAAAKTTKKRLISPLNIAIAAAAVILVVLVIIYAVPNTQAKIDSANRTAADIQNAMNNFLDEMDIMDRGVYKGKEGSITVVLSDGEVTVNTDESLLKPNAMENNFFNNELATEIKNIIPESNASAVCYIQKGGKCIGVVYYPAGSSMPSGVPTIGNFVGSNYMLGFSWGGSTSGTTADGEVIGTSPIILM